MKYEIIEEFDLGKALRKLDILKAFYIVVKAEYSYVRGVGKHVYKVCYVDKDLWRA